MIERVYYRKSLLKNPVIKFFIENLVIDIVFLENLVINLVFLENLVTDLVFLENLVIDVVLYRKSCN